MILVLIVIAVLIARKKKDGIEGLAGQGAGMRHENAEAKDLRRHAVPALTVFPAGGAALGG